MSLLLIIIKKIILVFFLGWFLYSLFKSWKEGRDAETGEFIRVEEARRRRSTATVETMRRKV